MKKLSTLRVKRRPPGVQYTVRGIPPPVDKALRRKAREEGKSFNEVLKQVLVKEVAATQEGRPLHHDLDALAGKWVEDPAFDEAVKTQDQVDESLWR